MRATAMAALTLAIGMIAAPVTAGSLLPAVSNDNLDNPHRGFMLWGTTVAADEGMPANYHGASIYHIYLPWREVETADQRFDWAAFERNHLQPILQADAKATFVLRPVADYPDGPGSSIDHFYTGGSRNRDYPLFLEQAPLRIKGTSYSDCGGDGPGRALDYNNPAARTQMVQFIQAFGARYDGDPRITAVQMGLLGFWGEWHTSGCARFEPNAETRRIVREAYLQAFQRTPLQARYARRSDIGDAPLGFAEDYFPSFTGACAAYSPKMPLCDDSGWWNLEYGFRNEVAAARSNWLANPVSGESPTNAQKAVWSSRTSDIVSLLKAYHFSWLGPAGAHESSANPAALRSIKRALGYELVVREAAWPDVMSAGGSMQVDLRMENIGAAPLYHVYFPELVWVDATGAVRARQTMPFALNTLTPNQPVFQSLQVTVPAILKGDYSLRLGFADPAPGRSGVIPQNTGRDSAGRLVLGNVQVF